MLTTGEELHALLPADSIARVALEKLRADCLEDAAYISKSLVNGLADAAACKSAVSA